MWRILCAGPSQESSARLHGRTAQVVLWPSVYTEQKAMCDWVTRALTAYLGRVVSKDSTV